MLIRITKGRDGPNILTCVREDGTSTWARVQDYFPLHDMTHFVVETTLGIPDAFYSLVRDGWDLSAFTVKGSAAKIPLQANLVEALVGRLQRELMPGTEFTTESYNEEVDAVLEGIGNPERRHVNDAELIEMRTQLRGLMARWKALEPGESIELAFPED